MNKPATRDIDPRAIAADFFRRLGGIDGMTKWGKTHRSLAYQLISKLLAQPLVTNNVNVANVAIDGEAARRKLFDEFMRITSARDASIGDPACYVNDELVVDDVPRLKAPDARPATGDESPDSNSEKLKSPQQGTVFSPGGVSEPLGAGQKTENSYSKPTGPSVPGLAAGAVLGEGADDNLSTTERFYNWRGHGRPP